MFFKSISAALLFLIAHCEKRGILWHSKHRSVILYATPHAPRKQFSAWLCFRDNSLISIVGGDTHSIPSGKEILDAGAEGLPCRGGVFNVVRVDIVGIPNDADFSVFSEILLEDPVRTARYQKLIESASESGKMMRLANLTAASDKSSCGKVLLTIDGKTRVLQTVGELELLNREDKGINLPSKS